MDYLKYNESLQTSSTFIALMFSNAGKAILPSNLYPIYSLGHCNTTVVRVMSWNYVIKDWMLFLVSRLFRAILTTVFRSTQMRSDISSRITIETSMVDRIVAFHVVVRSICWLLNVEFWLFHTWLAWCTVRLLSFGQWLEVRVLWAENSIHQSYRHVAVHNLELALTRDQIVLLKLFFIWIFILSTWRETLDLILVGDDFRRVTVETIVLWIIVAVEWTLL